MVASTTRTPSNYYEKEERNFLWQINEIWLWHSQRIGHIRFENLVRIRKIQVVRDILRIANPLHLVCKHCQHGKQTRVTFNGKDNSTWRPLELVHMDQCGPTRIKGLNGKKYFSFRWLFHLDGMGLLPQEIIWNIWVLQSHKKFIEKQTNKKIKCVRSDNTREFNSNEFKDYCE